MDLSGFTGTEKYYQVSMFDRTVCTDGVKYMADTAGAWWLVDVIVSHQSNPKVRKEPFQVWELTVLEDQSATVTCEDGNGHLITEQRIEYTDFPDPSIELYFINLRGQLPTILLPSEY